MSIPVAIYSRVSTSDTGQTVENQVLELRKVAALRGWTIAREFSDVGVSGAKGRDDRPGYAALCDAMRAKEVRIVMAWSIDRVSRSLKELVAWLDEAHGWGTNLYFHQQQIDTGTPSGRAMFQMIGVFAEFERAMIRERVTAGLERAKAEGKKLGRPGPGPRVRQMVAQMLRDGATMETVKRETGVHNRVLQNIRDELVAQGVELRKRWSGRPRREHAERRA